MAVCLRASAASRAPATSIMTRSIRGVHAILTRALRLQCHTSMPTRALEHWIGSRSGARPKANALG